ncbi:hypothetical protein ACI6QG_05340 [Roseococcus sp. DSY-14]|uniref:hypothetical protein n=1 Tax=Roseococcus sp. DSY-14 TaxID=3369650 RepID=UPI00387B228F
MPSLINPELFSSRFNINSTELNRAGLLDPILNADTKLFIDPLLIAKSVNKTISKRGNNLLIERFTNIVKLVDSSQKQNDTPWRAAAKLLDLDERPETGLGYGGATTKGNSRPEEIRQKIIQTAHEIVHLGAKNPEIISLMGLFDEGVGPDTISDLTANAIYPALAEITEDFCKKQSIPVSIETKCGRILPENPYYPMQPIVLVPRDILRDLPLAADWSDVSRVVSEISGIRDAFNNYLGALTAKTVSEKKRALKDAALQSLAGFRQLLSAVINASDSYDPDGDPLNVYRIREILKSNLQPFENKIMPPKQRNSGELVRVVGEIIDNFKFQIENNNLWELMWDNGEPKKEKAGQLLFFAVADVFCRANNLDISPETNAGGGPVDFKFSTGYHSRVLVEVKKSMGTVEHGYSTQLEKYKNSARTDAAFFLVMDLGKMGQKLSVIKKMRADQLKRGERASEIVVVDAKPKRSASKA